MNEAVLIFTFSPIQPFIAEARRTADLFAASQILVKLAQAAGKALTAYGTLVYPAALGEDMPNKIVLMLPWEEAKTAAQKGEQALLDEWGRIAHTARRELESKNPVPDSAWQKIWQRQIDCHWEIYWSAANLAGRSYAEAYREAERALAGTKRTRKFTAVEEHALKDSLSGRREALHTGVTDAKEYWGKVAQDSAAAKKLRPYGRERLDAIGAVKRFGELSQKSFPSTSTIAAGDFLDRARPYLALYRRAVEELLGGHLYSVGRDVAGPEWPYDGDLLFLETLTQHRLEDSYGVSAPLPKNLLREAQEKLRQVYQKVSSKPSPYYALIVLDGDDMGKKIDGCLGEKDPQEAHRDFSKRLREFSGQVSALVGEHRGHVVYGGGDDVVALTPLKQAFPLAKALSERFYQVTACSASAGIAVAHHLYPLGAAMQAAREAERTAKQVPEKASVCVKVLKRSGTTLTVCSRFEEFNRFFDEVCAWFAEKEGQRAPLAGKFAYDLVQAAAVLSEVDDMFKAELTRLFKRHRNPRHPALPEPQKWVVNLFNWAERLPQKSLELGHWLVLARFVGRGGSE